MCQCVQLLLHMLGEQVPYICFYENVFLISSNLGKKYTCIHIWIRLLLLMSQILQSSPGKLYIMAYFVQFTKKSFWAQKILITWNIFYSVFYFGVDMIFLFCRWRFCQCPCFVQEINVFYFMLVDILCLNSLKLTTQRIGFVVKFVQDYQMIFAAAGRQTSNKVTGFQF